MTALDSLPGRLFVGGEWIRGEGGALNVIDPTLGQAFATVDTPSRQQIALTVRRAGETQQELRKTAGHTRAAWLRNIAARLAESRERMAVLEARNVGKPLAEARLDIDDAVGCLQYYANLAVELDAQQSRLIGEPSPDFKIRVRHEPVRNPA